MRQRALPPRKKIEPRWTLGFAGWIDEQSTGTGCFLLVVAVFFACVGVYACTLVFPMLPEPVCVALVIVLVAWCFLTNGPNVLFAIVEAVVVLAFVGVVYCVVMFVFFVFLWIIMMAYLGYGALPKEDKKSDR